jgi:hypothetical protein
LKLGLINVGLNLKEKFFSSIGFFLDGALKNNIAKELGLNGFFLDHGGFFVLVSDGISNFLQSALSVIMCRIDFDGFKILLHRRFILLDLWFDDLDLLVFDLFVFLIQSFNVCLNIIGSNFEGVDI